MAMDASMASLRPWRLLRGTSLMEAGASSERSLARFLIPMLLLLYLTALDVTTHYQRSVIVHYLLRAVLACRFSRRRASPNLSSTSRIKLNQDRSFRATPRLGRFLFRGDMIF